MHRSLYTINYWLKRGSWLIVFLGCSMVAFAQLSDNSLPASLRMRTKSAQVIPAALLDSVRVQEQVNEDLRLGTPNRYAIVQPVDIDIREQGVRSELNGMAIWQYELTCPDALSLGVYFKTFQLPEGAAVYLYSKDRGRIRGGYTSLNNKESGRLALADFGGSSLIVEYNEPADAAFAGGVVIGSVSTAYLDVKSAALSQVYINCPEGDDWQDVKHAVCLMTFQSGRSSYYCSGALVNNVRTDGTPYFLTANHCISTTSEAASLVTYFNYENSSCTSNDASRNQTLSGAGLVATNNYTDFTLLRLDEYPPEAYEPYFAGWDATGARASSGTCIHHPEGGPKNIAIDNDPPYSYPAPINWDDSFISASNTHWEVSYDVGVDLGGSSGAPLFSENKRILGQLHGGDDNSSYFGKFSLSWAHSAETSKQLKAWLDPDNSGITTLDGWDYFSVPRADFVADVSVACLNTPVYLTDQSKNNPQSWQWTIEPAGAEFINGTTSTSRNPVVRFTNEGSYSISLVVSNENGDDTAAYPNLISAFQQLPVVLEDMPDEMTLCGSDIQEYQMAASGADELFFELTANEFFDIQADGPLLTLTLKEEARPYGSFDTYVKVTGTHGDCLAADSVLLHVVMPPNDDVRQAIALNLGRNAGFSNECGTVEPKEPYPPGRDCSAPNSWCAPGEGSVLDHSVWFSFPGTSSGTISISTSGFDTQIAVYEAASAADVVSGIAAKYTLVAANDNASFGTAAAIENLQDDPSKTYFLQVDGNNGATGNFTVSLLSSTIEVYPNPSNGLFHLTVGGVEGQTAELAVFSLLGQQIFVKTITFGAYENTIDLDLTGHPAGLYFFRVRQNGVVLTKKLMLTK